MRYPSTQIVKVRNYHTIYVIHELKHVYDMHNQNHGP